MSYFMNILTELVKILEFSTYKSMGKNINAISNIKLTLKVYKILGTYYNTMYWALKRDHKHIHVVIH